MNLLGDSVILSSGTRPATAFSLGGNVNITADPTGYVPIASPTQPVTDVMTYGYAITQPVQTAQTPVAAKANDVISPPASISGFMPVATITSPVLSSTSATTSNAALQGAGAGAVHATPDLYLNDAQSGSAVTSLLSGVSKSNLSTVLANINKIETPWISETELFSGKMPAIIYSDLELGIKNEVTTVVDLEDKTPQPESRRVTLADGTTALSGAVTREAKTTRMMHLKRGTVVFAPTVNTVVSTEFGQVKIAAHSLVMMMAFRDGVAVYDLDDSHRNAVSARVYNQEIPLGPGKHILITRDNVKSFEHVNPAQMLGYNNVTDYNVGGGIKVFAANFSIPSAMANVLPLSQLVASAHPQAQRVGNHLLKTAAYLGQMHNVPYEQIMRQSLTAYSR